MLAILAASSAAWAQRVDIAPDRTTKPPSLRVRAQGTGASVTAHAVLAWDGGSVEPSARQPYRAGTEPIAIAIVMDGREIFVGNDDVETDPNATYAGVLKRFEAGLDALHLDSLVPADSTIEVVTYAVGAKLLVPRKAISAFGGADLGSQKDYRMAIGADMVEGVELAAHELDQSAAPIKLLFVLGDGNGTTGKNAVPRLLDLAERLRARHIAVAGAIFKTAVSADENTIFELVPDARVLGGDGADVLASAVDKLTDRMYLAFDDASLPWDGESHVFTLSIEGSALPPVTVAMPGHPSHRWHKVLLGVAVGALLVGIAMLRRRRR